MVFSLSLALPLILCAHAGSAQDQPTASAADTDITTLHVYTNLQQLPTLVLNSLRHRMKPIDSARFRLSLDGGPLFKPTHVRTEGEDGLAFGLLIDLTVPKSTLIPALARAIEPLGTGMLRPQDHVFLYAADCHQLRSIAHLPGDSARLAQAIATILAEHAAQAPPPCKYGLPLWDTLSYVSRKLGHEPGWRILVTLSNGTDRGSKVIWQQARDTAQQNSVAIIGLLTAQEHPVGSFYRPDYLPDSVYTSAPGIEDPFAQVCELSGGIELASTPYALGSTLKLIATMMHERYILEFPRSNDTEPGLHDIEVTLLRARAVDVYIRPTGIVTPLADPKILADPSTVPSDPTLAPQFGKRKPLPAPAPHL